MVPDSSFMYLGMIHAPMKSRLVSFKIEEAEISPQDLKVAKDNASITCIAQHPVQNHLVLVAFSTGEVVLRDLLHLSTPNIQFSLNSQQADVLSCITVAWSNMSPNETLFVAGYSNGDIMLWNLPSNQKSTVITTPMQIIHGMDA